jgi:hypothetical protein
MKQSAEENEMRIESEIGINLAKYWYEKAKERAVLLHHHVGEGAEAVLLSDLAEILQQVPPIKEMTAAELYEIMAKSYNNYEVFNGKTLTALELIAIAKSHLPKQDEEIQPPQVGGE